MWQCRARRRTQRQSGSEVEALRRAVMQQFDQYVKLNKKIPPEILTSISSIDDAGRLADTIAAHLPLKLDSKQAVLSLSERQGAAGKPVRADRARSRHPATSTRRSVAASSARWRRTSATST